MLASLPVALRRWLLHTLALLGKLFLIYRVEAHPSRILIIKPDHLGDLLLATPALSLLRQQHPQALIVALVGPWSAAVLQHNPDVDVCISLPFPGFERHSQPTSLIRPYRLLLSYAALLRAGNFHAALLLRDDHWWGAALALLAGIPHRIGYATPESQPFLTTALPWNTNEHVTKQALGVVAAYVGKLGDRHDICTHLRFYPSDAERTWATTWLSMHTTTHGGTTPRLVIIHPGTGGQTKHWLPERWATVANVLAHTYDAHIVLTGGPGEEELVQHIAHYMDTPPLMLVGTTSIGQLAALLHHAALVIGVDSGPLHVAVSQGTPSIHLFGPSNADRFGPWGDKTQHVVLRSGVWCSPCGVFGTCPRHTDPPACMEGITVEQTVQACSVLLDR